MTSTVSTEPGRQAGRRIASDPGAGQAWWFLGTLAVLRNPEGAPRVPVVMELTIPPGGSPPRHVHDGLDDSFLLLDGEAVVRCGTETVVAGPGSYVCLPRGVEHTFRVTSRVPARMLQIHADDSFLGLVEALGVPTDDHRLPPPGEYDVDLETIVRANEEHDSRIVGPSLEEDEARSFLPPGSDAPEMGAVNHVSLTVTDLRRSLAWYTDVIGLVRVDGEVAEDGSGHIVLLSPTGGWLLTLASGPSAGVEHVAIGCRDRDELLRWHEVLANRRGEPGTVTDAPYGSGFVIRDPDGVELELFAPPSEPPPAGR